jgi:lysyl-tRNA synthetase class 2
MNFAQYGFEPQRLAKVEKLRQAGVEPYPYAYPRPLPIGELAGAGKGPVRAAGRLWARRRMGKVHFVDLRDHTGQVQLYLAKDELAGSQWERLPALDLGDWLGVEGMVFRTRTGELSIRVREWTLLAKALAPIPLGKEKEERVYYRARDPETRYRERYVHWLLDPGDRERVRQRARMVRALRHHLDKEGFLEVDTPAISPVYGGAEARPFEVEVWALERQRAFLRISPELHLKRYLVAGFERVFTLCANFRNEGMDRSHNPEFAMLEWYEAFSDYQEQMARFEELVAQVCRQVCGTTRIVYQGAELDFTPPWRRVSMLEAVKEGTGMDADSLSAGELCAELERRGVECGDLSWGQAVAALFKVCCEGHLGQPTFVLDHPQETSPLARSKRGDPRLAERFEAFVCGMELGNAYSELNDPLEQLERFQAQPREAHPIDHDFVRALGCGMPPAGGVGLGVDRLAMLLTNAESIRDVISFPMVKPLSTPEEDP